MPGWRRRSEPWVLCANAQSHTVDDSQATLSARCLSQFSHQTSEFTSRVTEEVHDFLKVSLETFAAQQRRLLQDALASGLPPLRVDARVETPLFLPHLGSERSTLTSSANVSGAVPHSHNETFEPQATDHKQFMPPISYQQQCMPTFSATGFTTGGSKPRRPSTDTTGTAKSTRSVKRLKRHRTLKDLESSFNNMLIASQSFRVAEECMERKQSRNDTNAVAPTAFDSKGQLSIPNTSTSGVSRYTPVPGRFPPNFSTVMPIDDGASSAPTFNSEESARGGLELTSSLRRAYERTLTAKLAEPEIFLSGDEPLAMEARSPRLSLCGIFLWLHLWGVLPWSFPGQGGGHLGALAMHLNQLLILLVATLTVVFRIGEVVLVSPEIHTVSNTLLAVGSFFCVLANWKVHRCNLFEADQRFLLNYAREHYFLRSWCWQSLWHLAEALLGWALTVASRAFLHSAEGGLGAARTLRSIDMVAYSLSTGIFFASTFCQLHCMNALVCSVDRFSLRFTQDPSVPKRIQDWNSLQAMLRQASLAMESCILVLLTTSMLMVFTCGVGSIVDPSFGIVQSMLPVALLWATTGRVLLKSAHVTNRCNRVPSFVTSLSAGCEGAQLSERFLLVQFMESIAAGFYVSEVKLTSNAAMKLVYAGCMVMTTIFTAAVSGPSGVGMR